MKRLRRWFRRVFNVYPPMTCKRCGHAVAFEGNRYEQADRAYLHWEANHNEGAAA